MTSNRSLAIRRCSSSASMNLLSFTAWARKITPRGMSGIVSNRYIVVCKRRAACYAHALHHLGICAIACGHVLRRKVH